MDQHEIHIDFIVAAYNAQDTILRTLESLHDQSDPRWNAIAVNDGSTDDTVSMVSSINDPRIRLISQPNAGPSAARNRGFAQSSSQLVCFLDADDTLDRRFVERMIPLALEGTLGASCGYDYVDLEGRALCQVPPMGAHRLGPTGMITLDPPAIMSMVYQRDALERVRHQGLLFDDSLRAFEDWEMLDRLVKSSPIQGDLFAQCDELLAHYWCTPGSLSSSFELVWDQGRALIESRCEHAVIAVRQWGVGILAGCVIARDHTTAERVINAIGQLDTSDVRSFVESLRWHTMRRLAIPLSDVDARCDEILKDCKLMIQPSSIIEQVESVLINTGDQQLEQLLKLASTMTSKQGRVVIFGLGRNGMRFESVADRIGVPVALTDDQPNRWADDDRRISPDSITQDDAVIVTPMIMDGKTSSLDHLDPSRILRFHSDIVVSSSR